MLQDFISSCRAVFLNRQAAARYRALASIILGRDRPEETTICYKISLAHVEQCFSTARLRPGTGPWEAWGNHNMLQDFISSCRAVFLNRQAAARYRALASIIPGRERHEENTLCYKISLIQLITNLNVILYLSTCHTVCISVIILFMIMT